MLMEEYLLDKVITCLISKLRPDTTARVHDASQGSDCDTYSHYRLPYLLPTVDKKLELDRSCT